MSRDSGFISPDNLMLSFPHPISTDEERILFALWRERKQALGRLCVHTGLEPLRVLRAVKSLAAAGRLRVNPEVTSWLDSEDTLPESDRMSVSDTDVDLSDRLADHCVSLR